jgi:nicotinamidase-related amidase
MTEALVLIDLQNDYFPGGTMELVDADGAVEQAALLLQSFRA